MSTYLHQHRRDITQTLMVDSPSDNLQTHKVSGRNSSRGGVGGPGRSKKTPGGCIKKSPGGCNKKSPGGCVKKSPGGRIKKSPGGCIKKSPRGCIKKSPGGALKNNPGGALKNHPGGTLKNHPGGAVQWSCVRATCGPLEPCACDLRTTRAVCARPANHRSRARPSEAV